MIKKTLSTLLFGIVALNVPGVGHAADFSFDQNYPEDIIINNRVLMKINGKAISVLDVVKKMDLLFYKQYPQLADSASARFQFYTSGWRSVLDAVIDDCLIMADAEEKEVVVNDGEVREELESLFGPDVVLNLDKLGMTLEEAFDLLKTELTVQRMTSVMVRARAMAEVHPTAIKKRYEKVIEENPPLNQLVYRVLSIRGEGHESVADEAHRLMQQQGIPFEEVVAYIRKEGVDLSYSDEIRQHEKDLSATYKAVLSRLTVGAGSAPVSTAKVSRLFCLKGVEKVEPPAFKQVEETLKRELTQEAIVRFNADYRRKLRKNYGLTEPYISRIIPDNLQPFALR